jgi:hypothetical protein
LSVIAEVVLHKVIVEGIRTLRKDNRLLESVFVDLDQDTLQSIKKLVNEQSIHLTFNYPRADALHTPAIAILLKNEQEAQTFLGDFMGGNDHYEIDDNEYDTMGGHAASIGGLAGLPDKVAGPLAITGATYASGTTQATISPSSLVEWQLALQGTQGPYDAYIVDGAGKGQVGLITHFGDSSIDIEGVFSPQLGSSSKIDIRLATNKDIAGEPSRSYSAGTTVFRKGANYDVQYQLSVIAGHQNETIYLYNILKAVLFSQKAYMERQGLMALKISGSDYAPRTDFLPNDVFQRVMILNFTYPFSYNEEIAVPTRFSLEMGTASPEDEDCTPAISFDIDITEI